MAVCSVEQGALWHDRDEAVDTLLARAETLAPSRAKAHHRSQIFETQRENFGVRKPRGRTLLGILVTSGLALALTRRPA